MAGPPGEPRLRRRPLVFDTVALAAAGALHTLAFVHTAWWPLQMLAVALLAACVARASPRRAAFLGWVFGTAWLAAGTWWLFVSMHRYGGLPAWMAVLAVGLLAAALSLYLAAAMAGFARWRRGVPWRDALLFAAPWLLAELARAVIFTGFPWVAAGYAHLDAPLATLAPWIGVYGIGFVAAALSAWVVYAGFAGWRRLAVAAGVTTAALVGLAVAPVPTFTTATGTLSVSLLQGNIAQEEKFASEHQAAALEWHVGELLGADTRLVVAPETALPFFPQQLPEGFWPALTQRFAERGAYFLFGMPLGDYDSGYTNSAVGIAPGGAAYRYDKHHLVPFGEFIPTGFRWFTQMMNIPLGDFARGPVGAPPFVVGEQRVAPNICYEDLFGEEIAASFAAADRAPTILANLSNIGWFGDTIAVAQHLNISRMRTLEFERPMLRATNTGATAVVDHRGVVQASLPPYTRGVLVAEVTGREGLTPFARWTSAFWLWPLWGLGAVLPLVLRRPRRRRPGP